MSDEGERDLDVNADVYYQKDRTYDVGRNLGIVIVLVVAILAYLFLQYLEIVYE